MEAGGLVGCGSVRVWPGLQAPVARLPGAWSPGHTGRPPHPRHLPMKRPLRFALLARLGRAVPPAAPVVPAAPPRRPRRFRRIAVCFLLFALAAGTLIALSFWWLVSGGLPVLDGELAVAG